MPSRTPPRDLDVSSDSGLSNPVGPCASFACTPAGRRAARRGAARRLPSPQRSRARIRRPRRLGPCIQALRGSIVGDIRPVLVGGVACRSTCCRSSAGRRRPAAGQCRARGIMPRSALGATRARILRQLLVESAVIATTNGSLSFVAALWTVGSLPALLINELPRTASVCGWSPRCWHSARVSRCSRAHLRLNSPRCRPAASGPVPRSRRTAGPASRAAPAVCAATSSLPKSRSRRWCWLARRSSAAALVGLAHVDPVLFDRLLQFSSGRFIPSSAFCPWRAGRPRAPARSASVEAVGGATGLPLVTPQRAIGLSTGANSRSLVPCCV